MATIYSIKCLATGKHYVGCTKAVPKRFREHRCLLNNGKHASPSLQADWDRFGSGSFQMVSHESLAPDATVTQKREAETRWMMHFKESGVLYNENMTSFQGTDYSMRAAIEASRHVAGNRWTQEANLKRRLAQLGKPKGHGAKISATKRSKRAV